MKVAVARYPLCLSSRPPSTGGHGRKKGGHVGGHGREKGGRGVVGWLSANRFAVTFRPSWLLLLNQVLVSGLLIQQQEWSFYCVWCNSSDVISMQRSSRSKLTPPSLFKICLGRSHRAPVITVVIIGLFLSILLIGFLAFGEETTDNTHLVFISIVSIYQQITNLFYLHYYFSII